MTNPFGNQHIETESQNVYADYPVSVFHMTGFTVIRARSNGEILVYDARRLQPVGYDCLAFVANSYDACEVRSQFVRK